MKKIISLILCFVLLFSLCTVSFAAEEKKSVSIACSNVAGLPIPSAFSDEKRVVPSAQKKLGKLLNECGADIVCVQEDFQFHFILAAQMKDYPYKTYTSGGIPTGDGLNVFSKYPIYNIERVAWEEFNGILSAGADGLTPKGFLKCTVDIDGVYTDLYNIHIDAMGSAPDQAAKKEQFKQLSKYIEENSASRPVIITGDMNQTLHTDMLTEFRETMFEAAGFADAWAELCNNGNYLYPNDPQTPEIIKAARNGDPDDYWYWGVWDSVERLLYRSGDGAVLTPVEHEYINFTDDESRPKALTDHNVMICNVDIDASDYIQPDIDLEGIRRPLFILRVFNTIKQIFRDLYLIAKDLIRMASEKQ